MLQSERLEAIPKLLASENVITIQQLCRSLDCSNATIRRDITILESQGLVVRIGGCVTLPERMLTSSRKQKNPNSKRAIAQYAATLVESNDIIFMDSSTTVSEMTSFISKNIPYTVVTNDLAIASKLESYYNIHLILLGGIVRHGSGMVSGPMSVSCLNGMSFRKAFLGAAAISRSCEIMYFDLEEADFRKQILDVSQQIYILADQSKFFTSGLKKVIHASQITALITDKFSPDSVSILQNNGVRGIEVLSDKDL